MLSLSNIWSKLCLEAIVYGKCWMVISLVLRVFASYMATKHYEYKQPCMVSSLAKSEVQEETYEFFGFTVLALSSSTHMHISMQ